MKVLCRKKFISDKKDKKHQKVKDHCHYAEKFRGTAHNVIYTVIYTVIYNFIL